MHAAGATAGVGCGVGCGVCCDVGCSVGCGVGGLRRGLRRGVGGTLAPSCRVSTRSPAAPPKRRSHLMSVISRNVICTTSLPWNPASRRAEERRLQFGHAIGRGLVVGWWLAGGRRWAWVGGRTGRCTGLDLHPLIRDLVARPRLPREGGREGDDAHHREERQAGDEGLRDRGRALEERLLRDELLRRRGRGRALLLRPLLLDLLPVRGRVLRRLRVVGHLRRARPHHGAMRAQGRGRKDDGASERERAREELYGTPA